MSNTMDSPESALKKTALHALHLELGARMVPFAGYEMPVQYATGIIKEHQHTRQAAGLFDVSHMGQVRLVGDEAAIALESLVPMDIVDLPVHHQRYSLFTNAQGGILDDLIVTNAGDHLFVVVNAGCKEQDFELMRSRLSHRCKVEVLAEQALLALQGPQAAAVLQRLGVDTTAMMFMTARSVELAGTHCFITRCGYTGEDGFEISVPNDRAEALARLLLSQPEVAPVGLGARDSLRLEAGLCLYGHDIDTTTTPVEANLVWALSRARRPEGARPGGYPGYEVICEQLARGAARKRVGIRPQTRSPVREGSVLFNQEGEAIGKITSGSFGPTVNGPIAMAYVDREYAVAGTHLQADLRGQRVAVDVAPLPFVAQRYYRG